MPTIRELGDAGRDLLLGSACVGCGAPGRALCATCDESLPRGGVPAWPRPAPSGLAPPYAAGAYGDLLKVLVLAHKEHAVLALTSPLGGVLAGVVASLLAGRAPPGLPVTLVPVPSRAAVVRRRGHDPLLRVARAAAGRLRASGVDARVGRLLLPAGRVLDQAGLDARARAVNLAGSMRCRPGAWRRPGAVVIVDDVLTTGATAREAQRALEAADVAVTGIAVVAATARRAPERAAAGGPASLPFPGRAV